ncbi:MAG: hypothetical protein RLO51_13100 [Thalassobaculum sp.]|uniref:hypothetical protein n=1 Tax=Thalassobaculum sp. TaxID=2022740 RepID=UPI0032EE4D9C
MTREPESLILEYLRRLDAGMQLLREDVGDLKRRLTGVEEGLAGVNRRLDRLDGRVERIERRLDLAEA